MGSIFILRKSNIIVLLFITQSYNKLSISSEIYNFFYWKLASEIELKQTYSENKICY